MCVFKCLSVCMHAYVFMHSACVHAQKCMGLSALCVACSCMVFCVTCLSINMHACSVICI